MAISKYAFRPPVTGAAPVIDRREFSDASTLEEGWVCRTSTSGCLDAPDFLPLGSMRNSGTFKEYATPSVGYRNGAKAAAARHYAVDGALED